MPKEELHQLLLEKFDHLRELMELKFAQMKQNDIDIITKIENMQGEVNKNSEFRIRAKTWITVVVAVLGFFVPATQYFVKLFLNNFF